jgi:hypothetical protein
MANVQLDSLTDTWNNGATTFNAVKMNVTDTASAAASKLIDLQVGGNTKANVTKAGLLTLASGLTLTGANTIQTTTGALTIASGSSNIILTPTSNVGIGTTGPDRKLDVLDASNPQLRLTQADGTAYSEFQALSTGHLSCVTSGGNRITSTTTNDTSVLARQAQGGLAFDGVTASTRVTHTLGSGIGTGDFSVRVSFICPTSTSTVYGVLNINSSNSDANAVGSFQLYFNGDGTLKVRIFGPGSTADSVFAYVSGFVTSFAGKAVDAVFTRSGTTDVLYANGVAQTLTEGSGGTNPTWAASIPGTYVILGSMNSSLFNSTIFSATLFNRALSAAEVVTLVNSGVQESDKWGSLTAKYTSDFSAGVDGWGIGGALSALDGNVDGIGGQDNNLRLTCDNTTTVHYAWLNSPSWLLPNKRYRMTYSYYMPSSNVACTGIAINNTGNYQIENFQAATNSWTTRTFEFTSVATSTQNMRLYFLNNAGSAVVAGGGGDLVYFRGITITEIGSILDADLSAGVGYQVPDRSSNKYHGVVSATGTAWTLAQRRGQLRATTNTSGDERIFSSQVSLPTNAIITSIVGYTTGTPTIKIGNVSAGSQLVASVAMSASTYQSFTVAATTSTTGNVWVNSSTADTINWTITYMIADS